MCMFSMCLFVVWPLALWNVSTPWEDSKCYSAAEEPLKSGTHYMFSSCNNQYKQWHDLQVTQCTQDFYVFAVSQLGVPTFSGSCGPQVVNGPQDEPEGLLLFARDAQHLHGCLQLGELLRGSLLVFRLEKDMIRSNCKDPWQEVEMLQQQTATSSINTTEVRARPIHWPILLFQITPYVYLFLFLHSLFSSPSPSLHLYF